MAWTAILHSDFEQEFNELSEPVQNKLSVMMGIIEKFGPTLGRPKVDTLSGSNYPNMKEIRFDADGGVWRAAFAFDQNRVAVILAIGNKTGVPERKFYNRLIQKADRRLDDHYK